MKNNYSEDVYGIERGQLYQITFEKEDTTVTTIKGVLEAIKGSQIMIRVDGKGLFILKYKNVIEMFPIQSKEVEVKKEKELLSHSWETPEKFTKEGITIFTEAELKEFTLGELLELSLENKLKALKMIDEKKRSVNIKSIYTLSQDSLKQVKLDDVCQKIMCITDIVLFRQTLVNGVIEVIEKYERWNYIEYKSRSSKSKKYS